MKIAVLAPRARGLHDVEALCSKLPPIEAVVIEVRVLLMEGHTIRILCGVLVAMHQPEPPACGHERPT